MEYKKLNKKFLGKITMSLKKCENEGENLSEWEQMRKDREVVSLDSDSSDELGHSIKEFKAIF